MTTFECDKSKARSNFHKHKLRFTDAARAINAGYSLTNRSPQSENSGEDRYLTIIGRKNERAIVAVWTPRQSNMRIISVRHARNKEQEAFDAYIRQAN